MLYPHTPNAVFKVHFHHLVCHRKRTVLLVCLLQGVRKLYQTNSCSSLSLPKIHACDSRGRSLTAFIVSLPFCPGGRGVRKPASIWWDHHLSHVTQSNTSPLHTVYHDVDCGLWNIDHSALKAVQSCWILAGTEACCPINQFRAKSGLVFAVHNIYCYHTICKP